MDDGAHISENSSVDNVGDIEDGTSQNDQRGITIQKTSSGSYKAVLETGLGPEEAGAALSKLLGNGDISHLDISAFPLNSAAAAQNEELAKILLPFALKPTIVNIILPVNTKQHCLEGACRGIVIETLRRVIGVNRIDILGIEVKLSCLVNINEITSKFVIGDAIGTMEMKSTCDVLTRIDRMTNVPFALCNAILKAAKCVRSRRRHQNTKINSSSTRDPEPTEHPAHEVPRFDEDYVMNGEKEAKFIPRQVAVDKWGQQKHCYICKKIFSHPSSLLKVDKCWSQYPSMCHKCASQNMARRNQRGDLRGKYAVVTGGRIKIGYHVVLKLLRDGCNVITTTRFPRNAACRFQEETDFIAFKDRLKIFKMDLKNLNSVYAFITYVDRTFPHLDILINNAAQTIRRPQQFFDHMLPKENEPLNSLPEHIKLILADDSTEEGLLTDNDRETYIKAGPQSERTEYVSDAVIDSNSSYEVGNRYQYEPTAKKKLKLSESLDDPSEIPSVSSRCSENPEPPECSNKPNSQVHRTYSTATTSSSSPVSSSALSTYFPPGLTDQDGQQLDMRPENSWVLGLEQVPLSELLEVLAINSVAPFILVQRLKTQLDKSPAPRRFIVNVSAMEGQFSRANKGHFHPHTNMAKAALNMLTRTAGVGFAEKGVYMSAVDTGWVTDENPYGEAKRREEAGFILPLDVVDGAARVYDPIVSGYNDQGTKPHAAVFLKDYKPYPW